MGSLAPRWIGHAAQLYDFRRSNWSPEYQAFPSATTTVTTGIAAVLSRHLRRWRPFWVTVPIVLLAAALAVNGHWVSDILAGVFVGAFIGAHAAKSPVSEPDRSPPSG